MIRRSTLAWLVGVSTLLFACSLSAKRTIADDGAYELTFFNISDTHVVEGESQNTWRLAKDSASILRSVIRRVEDVRPDLALFSGDIIEGKGYGMRNLRLASSILRQIGIPWLVLAGNHDGRYTKKYRTLDKFRKAEFYREFRGHGPDGVVGYWRHDVPGKKITFVGLDPSIEGESGGLINPTQKRWLEQTLSGIPAERTVVIVMHHPTVVFNPLILDPDKHHKLNIFVIDNHEEVRAILERHRNVKLVVSGHTHSPEHAFVNGIHYVSTPSINSWPCRYTRFVLRRDRVDYEHLEIPIAEKIEEAYRGLIQPGTTWMELFGTETDTRGYFAHGPMAGSLELKP